VVAPDPPSASPAPEPAVVEADAHEAEAAPPDFTAPAEIDAPREHAFSPSTPPGFEEDIPNEELPSIDAIEPFTDPPPPEADPFFEDETIAGVESLFDDEPGFVDTPHIAANIDAPTEEMSRDQLFSDEAEMAFGLSLDDLPAPERGLDQGSEEGTSSFDADLFEVDAFDEDVDDEWALKDPASGKKRIGLALAVLMIGGAFWWISQQPPEEGTLEEQVAAAEEEAAGKQALEEQVLADLAAKRAGGEASADGEAGEAVAKAPELAAQAPVVAKAPTKRTPALRGTKPSPPPLPPAMKPKPTRSKLTASKLVNAGWTAIGEGQFGNARKSFIDAVGLEPRNAMAHYGLGYAADKQGDDEGALKYFCKAQALTGGAGEVAREVEGILARKSWECR